MKEGNVSKEPRLVQVFLSQATVPGPGIYEVSSTVNGELSCTCPGFKSRGSCKHIKFVNNRLENNNGNYPLEISSRATQEDAEKAKLSNEDFREFIIKFGKIEVF
jgi:uncharacterized Zn finger protein